MNCLLHRIISRTKYIQKQPSAMVWKQADWIGSWFCHLLALWPQVSHLSSLGFSVITHNWKHKVSLPLTARAVVRIK